MKCRDARELINSYIDNGLDPEKDKFLMQHIEKCSRCGEELRFLIAYRKTVKKIKPVKAPAGFVTELNKRLALEKKSVLRNYFDKALDVWQHFTFPIEAVGVIAVALLIFFLYTPLFHGVKKSANYNEEQVITGTKSLDEQIKERRKLLPPAEKKKKSERLQLSSEKDVTKADKTDERVSADEEETPAAIDDSVSGMSRRSAEDSIYEKDTHRAAAGILKSESVKRDESPGEMKKAVSAKEMSRSSSITPEKIIAEFNGKIINKNAGRYTVKVSEEKLQSLVKKLRKNYSSTYKITGRSGGMLTVEFTITE
jgi:hypothetical protein